MKKSLLALSALFVSLTLVGCGDYFSSPEKKAFDQFLAQCKKNPASEACKAYEAEKKSPGGN